MRASGLVRFPLLIVLLACGDDATEEPKNRDSGSDSEKDAGSDAGTPMLRHADRTLATNVGTTGSIDYSKAEHWACRPDIEPNECYRNIDATEVKLDNTLQIIPHELAQSPAFDCFYVYPTVFLNSGPQMLDFSEAGIKLVLDPLLSQAARFTSLCDLYVPMYRQAGLMGSVPDPGGDIALALKDVRDAFAYYLEHDNRGRNFVILSHSQGTYLSTSLIQRDVDPDEAVRSKLISAVLLGGQPYTPNDALVGGAFQNIPICNRPEQTGCVMAYVSYAAESPPQAATALFGKVKETFVNEPVDLNGKVACTDPAEMSGNDGRYAASYFPLQLNNPVFGVPMNTLGITTPFVVYRELFRGECKFAEGRSWLEVRTDRTASDKRELPPYRNPVLESLGFGLHTVDYNIGMGDLLESVRRRANAMSWL